MANTEIQMLDLDAVVPASQFVIKLGGQEHYLQPVSVEGFIENTREMSSLASALTVEDEVNGMIKLLLRAFPTMTDVMLRGLELYKLYKILEFANQNNGQDQVTKEASADAGENPQKAGQ